MAKDLAGTASGPSVGGLGPQAGWLWGLMWMVYEQLCRSWPHEVVFIPAGSGVCQDLPFGLLPVELIRSCSYTEASRWRYWFWCLSGKTPVQVNVRCCLWQALGHLLGATKWSTLVAAYSGPGCAWEGPSCLLKQPSISTAPGAGQQNAQGTLRFSSTSRLRLGSANDRATGGTWDLWGRFSVTR